MFYNKFLSLCSQRGESPTPLLKKLSISAGGLANWRNGFVPSAETLQKLADYFGVSIDYLLERTEIPLPINAQLISGEFVSLPIIGTISAGYDGLAQEEYTGEYLEIPREILSHYAPAELYILSVKGDSMYPDLLDGDRVLVYRTSSVDSGTVAVVLYNGDAATVKRVEYEQGKDYIDLIPRNPEFKTKHIEGAELENCRILGKVVYLFRKF